MASRPEGTDGGMLAVTVAYSPAAREVDEREVQLPAGTCVRDAVLASGLVARHPGLDLTQHTVAVWGRAATPDQPLRHQDRVEVLRPLRVDPKVARRERFQRQGARTAGLFARDKNKAGPQAGS